MSRIALRLFPMALMLAALQTAAEDPAVLKSETTRAVEARKKQIQAITDTVFSFAELGFQEQETFRYLTALLEKEGFHVERGIAGIPTAWVATWGSGKPVIALGADLDCIPRASQKPGVAYHDPLVEGAPGHGEGHNAGQALNIAAALAVKQVMERHHLSGTIRLWPGIAEELVATKAHYVRAGLFRDVDAVLFAHVADNFGVQYGPGRQVGLVSVEYHFTGESAHAAIAPWLGRSALDAVELMDVGWNFRREHLRLEHRSHYIITSGGDQPNVVPESASVWYYFRETDYSLTRKLWSIGDDMARGATLMTNTTFTSRVLGSAWPPHFNKPIAEAAYANIKKVGLPAWSAGDVALARAVQREIHVPEDGLPTKLADFPMSLGGSDDIGDISWNVPTIMLMFPANIPNLPGHHWANAISMATPLAYKGTLAGAKAQAMTMIDLLTEPALLARARDYFVNVQTKEQKYQPLLRPEDKPAIWLNHASMEAFRAKMRPFYYDASRYNSYLEQLGIHYPVLVRKTSEPK